MGLRHWGRFKGPVSAGKVRLQVRRGGRVEKRKTGKRTIGLGAERENTCQLGRRGRWLVPVECFGFGISGGDNQAWQKSQASDHKKKDRRGRPVGGGKSPI